MTLYQIALLLSCTYHMGQVDKSGVPYINHPLAVSKAFSESAGKGAEKIVAILHDVVEDTVCTLEILSELFPKGIVEAVDAISRRDTELRRDYLHRVMANPVALSVKFADIAHNSSPNRLANLEPKMARDFKKMYEKDLGILREDKKDENL